MTYTLHIIQIISAVLLIALVLLQRTSGDMGTAMGDNSFSHTRRGADSFFFNLTVFVSVVFVATSLAVIVIARA